MLLEKIYARNIQRRINPAVVVSNQKEDTVKAEIGEYVFTLDLMENLYKMLDTLINKKSGKTGIWINGYYGSGKSHFIKYIHYCLERETSPQAFQNFRRAVAGDGSSEGYDNMGVGRNVDLTEVAVATLEKKIQSSEIDNIMFNVEDETDDGGGERLTRIFLNMFNRFRGYNGNDIPLALLFEKYLDQKGQLENFKKLLKERFDYVWEEQAALVASYELDTALSLAKELVPEMDTVSLHNKLSNPDAFPISIRGTLIPEFQNFLKTKDRNYRLLFLVDEISQYIGSNKEILLNFQNIIERVSEDCNNQIWIACTAQQSLEEVSYGVDNPGNNQDEFGKILGRFETRISLQSTDSAFITQKRVLEKNSVGGKAVGKLYLDNEDYILNQFKINHDLYKGYQTAKEFELAYPFVPYQFRLISHVFEAFQNLKYVIKEVKDNERSVLGITHYTAQENANKNVGDFIPFDAFFNGQFRQNLTHYGEKAIEPGLSLDFVQKDPFAKRVLTTLFMISNLLERHRQTFPPNLDNLTVLLMDQLDQNKMELQNKIKGALEKLITESILREEKGNYFFFNEEEMDVQNLIKAHNITQDDRLSIIGDLFQQIAFGGKGRKKFSFGIRDFEAQLNIEGKELGRNGDFTLKVIAFDTKRAEDMALDSSNKELLLFVNEWFTEDQRLRKDMEWYGQTKGFLNSNTTSLTGSRARTIETFRTRNEALLQSIKERFTEYFSKTRIGSERQVITADKITGSNPKDRLESMVNLHLKRIYSKNELAQDYCKTDSELKRKAATLSNRQLSLTQNLTNAEETVDNHIRLNNNEISAELLFLHFGKAPFGWPQATTLDIALELVLKKKRVFKYNNEPNYPIGDFVNKALGRTTRSACVIAEGEDIDPVLIQETIASYQKVFNQDLTNTTDGQELFTQLKDKLQRELDSYRKVEEAHGRYPFVIHFQDLNRWLDELIRKRQAKELFEELTDQVDRGEQLVDEAKSLSDFIAREKEQYLAIKAFHDKNRENFSELSPSHVDEAKLIRDFLLSDSPRHDYRHARKAYDSLQKALEAKMREIQEATIKAYQEVKEEVLIVAEKQGLEDYKPEEIKREIERIHHTTSITHLKNKKLEVSDYKAAQISKVIDLKRQKDEQENQGAETTTGEPVNFRPARMAQLITNKEELESYLHKLRKEMLDLLNDNKTIILK